jgi:phosphopantothenoylcysteine decarboxylase/phosphopantothenate--cysteine ligase
MQIDLKGKSILLGVTGSISAYKACDLARLFVKAGASVSVVMTSSAERFVSALTFEALTRNAVLREKSESWASTLNHIDMGKACDIFVIAPASANTMNKLSQGIADSILTQTALACKKPMLIAPSANTQMLENPATLKSLKKLKKYGYHIVKAQTKVLACGDLGKGALAEIDEIFFETARVLLSEDFWKNREVIVTGGGTREKIDEVRYISNFSSGKMAKALVLSAYLKGAKVSYLSTMGFDNLPLGIKTLPIEDAKEMFEETQNALSNTQKDKMPYLFMVSAVADYTPSNPQRGKLKKASLGEDWNINLTQTTDILAYLDKSSIKTIAFKAEMDSKKGFNHATALLSKKKVDAVCYNLLKDAKSFGGEENEISFITPTQSIELGRRDKLSLSLKILNQAQRLLDER